MFYNLSTIEYLRHNKKKAQEHLEEVKKHFGIEE